MSRIFGNLFLKQILIGIVTLGIFISIAVYIFSQAKPTTAKAEITNVLMARGIDSKGNPVGISQQFSSKRDKSIYAIVDLKNATVKTKVAYIRFYQGRYIDSKVTVPDKDNAAAVFFNFEKASAHIRRETIRSSHT